MLAIITLTTGGLKLAESIQTKIRSEIFYKPKPFSECVKNAFESYDDILFIMATGIVVRSIGPYLKHKSLDPAIVVMDEKGDHVISLLSGHLGGANALSVKLAEIVGGRPVITTASDVNNLLSVDMFAQKYNLVLEDFEGARDVTAVLVDGGQVQLKYFQASETNYTKGKGQAIVYVSHSREDFSQPNVRLMKKNLVLGIGCRRDTSLDQLNRSIRTFMQGYSIQCLTKICSAWLKADEKCLIEFSNALDIPFETFDQISIKSVESMFEGSDFVRDTIGVSCVSEPTGYLGSNKGTCLKKKVKDNGITLSLWEIN